MRYDPAEDVVLVDDTQRTRPIESDHRFHWHEVETAVVIGIGVVLARERAALDGGDALREGGTAGVIVLRAPGTGAHGHHHPDRFGVRPRSSLPRGAAVHVVVLCKARVVARGMPASTCRLDCRNRD